MTMKSILSMQSRSLVWIIGVAGFLLLMFGMGYSLGWFWKGSAAEADDMAHPATEMGSGSAQPVASLDDLLPRLEAKVAADPNDYQQRLLLAQTYVELGQQAKGIEQLRQMHKQKPNDNPTTILLATSLMQEGTQPSLRESSKLLEEAARAKPAVMPMVRLYQGEIQMKLGNAPEAIKIWKGYLGKMSAADPRRAMFEEKIAQASAKP